MRLAGIRSEDPEVFVFRAKIGRERVKEWNQATFVKD